MILGFCPSFYLWMVDSLAHFVNMPRLKEGTVMIIVALALLAAQESHYAPPGGLEECVVQKAKELALETTESADVVVRAAFHRCDDKVLAEEQGWVAQAALNGYYGQYRDGPYVQAQMAKVRAYATDSAIDAVLQVRAAKP